MTVDDSGGTVAKVRLIREQETYFPVLVVVYGDCKHGRFEYRECHHLSCNSREEGLRRAEELAKKIGVAFS